MSTSLGKHVTLTKPDDFGKLLEEDRKSTRLNSSHDQISYAVFCLKKKKMHDPPPASYASTLIAVPQIVLYANGHLTKCTLASQYAYHVPQGKQLYDRGRADGHTDVRASITPSRCSRSAPRRRGLAS